MWYQGFKGILIKSLNDPFRVNERFNFCQVKWRLNHLMLLEDSFVVMLGVYGLLEAICNWRHFASCNAVWDGVRQIFGVKSNSGKA
jgi:hypothetical protein